MSGTHSHSLVLPQQRLVVGVISAIVDKELGERNFCFDSKVKIETLHGGERDCCRMRGSCQFTSGPRHFSDAPLFRSLGHMRTPPAGLLPLLRRRRSPQTTERSEQWSVRQMTWTPKWTDSSLLKTSFSNAACVCCCWDVEVNRKWLYNHLLKGLQRHLGVADSAKLRPSSKL